MTVIALTHEIGSLSKDVEDKLVERLKLQHMTNEVVEHVAGRMHIPTSLVNRMREGKAGLVERFSTDRHSLALYTAEEVFNFASRGNAVVRGWGATCLLRPVAHVVCVRITRSFDKRVQWLMKTHESYGQEIAETEIRLSDEAHASRMSEQFGVTWGSPDLYDLTLNADRLSVDSCVEQIATLVARPEFQPSAGSRAALSNLTLDAAIRAEMKDHAATRNTSITLASSDGVVTLRGIVYDQKELNETKAIVGNVPGVSRVINELRVMENARIRRHLNTPT